MQARLLIVLLAIGASSLAAETRSSSQRSIEYQNLMLLTPLVQFFDTNHVNGQKLTNIAQVFDALQLEGLNLMQERFDRFGTNRGYENSILEKYVIVPDGVRVFSKDQEEVVLVNALPFPDEEGSMRRGFISRRPEAYRAGIATEQQIQTWFNEAQIEIPTAPKFDPLPRLPEQRTLDDMTTAEIEALLGIQGVSTGAISRGTTNRKNAGAIQTNATSTLAIAESAPKPSGWWLPAAVFAGLGVIAFLLLRARRRA